MLTRIGSVRWALRTIALFALGVIPAILLILFLFVMLVFTGPALQVFGDWFAAMIVLAFLGVIGLWSATFQDEEERLFPTGLTVALLLCGLLGAGPILVDAVTTVSEGDRLSMWLSLLLVGPVACAVYFFFEQIAIRLSK